MEDHPQSYRPATGCLVRLFWAFFGNAALFILGVYIYEQQAQALSIFDGLYFLILAAIILSRFLDIRFLNGETVYGHPASLRHFRKYVAVILPVFIVLLMLAHVLGILFP